MTSVFNPTTSSAMSIGPADQKILEDLRTLDEQIELCLDMWKATDRHPMNDLATSDEALLGVIGFLEACVPRMVELIEAATQGVLSEATLEKCLETNDRLLRVLSDCDTPDPSKPASSSSAPPAMAFPKKDLDLDLDDLLLSEPPTGSHAASSVDPFGGTPSAASTKFSIDDVFGENEPDPKRDEKPSSNSDDFDDFFK
jgi:hypothetical protein